jgi:hypothetical protein
LLEVEEPLVDQVADQEAEEVREDIEQLHMDPLH